MEIKILIEELEDKVEISQKIELKDKRYKMQEDKENRVKEIQRINLGRPVSKYRWFLTQHGLTYDFSTYDGAKGVHIDLFSGW